MLSELHVTLGSCPHAEEHQAGESRIVSITLVLRPHFPNMTMANADGTTAHQGVGGCNRHRTHRYSEPASHHSCRHGQSGKRKRYEKNACDECRWNYITFTDQVAGSNPVRSIIWGPVAPRSSRTFRHTLSSQASLGSAKACRIDFSSPRCRCSKPVPGASTVPQGISLLARAWRMLVGFHW